MKATIARSTLITLLVVALTGPVTCDVAFARTPARRQAAAAPAQGPLIAWAEDSDHQLGDGSTMDEYGTIAVNEPFGLRANQARAGSFAVAVNASGQVYAWGRGNQGEMGNGRFASRSRPVGVHLPKGAQVTSARAGFEFAIALTSTGRVLTWGNNFVGELGDGKQASKASPVYAKLPGGTKIKAIAAGTDRVFAVTSAGSLLAWGGNNLGSLGVGASAIRRTPVRVHLPRGIKVVSASAGTAAQPRADDDRQGSGLGLQRWRPARRRHPDPADRAGLRAPAQGAAHRRHRGRALPQPRADPRREDPGLG